MNKNRKQLVQQAAATHRAALRKSLEHRLEIARASGNQRLIRLLEQEAEYLG